MGVRESFESVSITCGRGKQKLWLVVEQKKWSVLYSIVSLSAALLQIKLHKQRQNLAVPNTTCNWTWMHLQPNFVLKTAWDTGVSFCKCIKDGLELCRTQGSRGSQRPRQHKPCGGDGREAEAPIPGTKLSHPGAPSPSSFLEYGSTLEDLILREYLL